MENEFEKAEKLNRARLENPSIQEDSIPKQKNISKNAFVFLLILAIIGDAGDFLNLTGIGAAVSFIADIILGLIMLVIVGFAAKKMGQNLAKMAGSIFADFIPFIDIVPFRTAGTIWIYKSQ